MIDARKHSAFGPDETPSRAAFNDLSLSIRDVVPVANTTERAQVLADLTDAGFPPSPSNPLYVHRADAVPARRLEVNDGSGWRSVAPHIQHGVKAMPANTLAAGGATSTGGTVTLDVAMESANYDVGVTLRSAQSGTANLVPRVTSVTTTGFVIWIYNTGSSSTSWTGDLLVGWKATLA